MRRNVDLRTAARDNGVYLWELAERMGVTDATFSRQLRREFTKEQRERALKAIEDIVREREEAM